MLRRHQRDSDACTKIDAVVPIVRFGRDCRIVIAHDGVVAERRDDARAMRRGEPRQRVDIEMIVMAVGHQHDVDGRQIRERDAGIVHALRSDGAERRGSLRPHGIE